NTGTPAANAFVEIQTPIQAFFISAGSTDAGGHLTIANVPAGAFVLRVHRPGNQSNVTVDVPGTLATQAQAVPVAAVLPPVGTIVVSVTSLAGVPVANANVQGDTGFQDSFQNLGATEANGQLTIPNVLGGRAFRIRAFSSSGQFRESTGTLSLEG